MVTHLSLKKAQPESLYLDKLPPATARAFSYLVKSPLLKNTDWYLAGGTALALQVGHRKSVDLDFFLPRAEFDKTSLERSLAATKEWETTYQENGTLYGKLKGAKMSFIAYPFFKPSRAKVKYGNMRVLIPEDIAVMKIIAVSQRGRKRDFVDLYWYCRNREPLVDIIRRTLGQYPGQEHNLPHIIKSLTYFDDADKDPMPQTYFEANWKTIKAFFKKEARAIDAKLLK